MYTLDNNQKGTLFNRISKTILALPRFGYFEGYSICLILPFFKIWSFSYSKSILIFCHYDHFIFILDFFVIRTIGIHFPETSFDLIDHSLTNGYIFNLGRVIYRVITASEIFPRPKFKLDLEYKKLDIFKNGFNQRFIRPEYTKRERAKHICFKKLC